MIPSKETVRNRILSRVERDKDTGCWVYCGFWDKFGSGHIKVGEIKFCVRKVVAWVYGRCELWDETYVARTCRTPACCNPRHIAVFDGLSSFMSHHQRGAKRKPYITKGRVLCARLLIREGWTYQQVADEMGVSLNTVWRLAKKKPRVT